MKVKEEKVIAKETAEINVPRISIVPVRSCRFVRTGTLQQIPVGYDRSTTLEIPRGNQRREVLKSTVASLLCHTTREELDGESAFDQDHKKM